MSIDDFEQDPVVLYEKWLNEPFKEIGQRYECMDKCCISYCKEAFIHAYKLGYNAREKSNWNEMNQK